MDELNSEENDIVDDILTSLRQDETVRVERHNLKTLHSEKSNESLNEAQDLRYINSGCDESFEIFINTAEVVLEDGLTINDLINEEVVITSEAEGSSVSSTINVLCDATNNEGENNVYEEVVNEKAECSVPKTATVLRDVTNDGVVNFSHQLFLNDDSDNDLNDPDYVCPDNILSRDAENRHTISNSKNEASTSTANGNTPNFSHAIDNYDVPINRPNTCTTLANDGQNLCNVEVADNDENIGQRKRNKRPNKASWNVNVHKKLRMEGKKYIGYTKIKVNGKILVKRSDHDHEERKMGPVCVSKVCKVNIKRKCTEIREEERETIFKKFWTLSWKEKQVYVQDHIKKIKTQQKTKKVENSKSRREGTLKYYLDSCGEFKPVCKVMFLNTLGVGEWMVHNWVKAKESDGNSEEDNPGDVHENDTPPDVNANHAPPRQTNERKITEKKKVISDWLDELPQMPSHYCRASSSKLYLEPTWHSKKDLYDKYIKFCTDNNKPRSSICTFSEVFEEKNLSIFVPRKDQCDTCYAYRAKNISQEVYDKHIQEKDVARSEKEKDKELAKSENIYCLTADVEAVKLSPMTKANAMYYKTKLCSHNYTVYNLATKHTMCYWFNEVEGDLSANTFASCLTHYLKENCLSPKRPIVIYTDGCTNQNRNQHLSNALLHFAVQNKIQLTQKFLVKGHTQMEGDSVHARIENRIKNKDIYVPFEYVKFTKEARKTPFPYEAMYLKFDFFNNYCNIKYYDSVRPGRKKGEPTVMDVHCFKYCPEGKIQYKLSFDDEYQDLPRRANKVDKDVEPVQLFTRRIPIPHTKWKHLQDLKHVIPEDYHQFYDSLPFVE